MADLPESPYKEFIVRTEEGRRRLKIWLDLVIRAVEGDRDAFYADQDRVGYARAVQGFRMEHMPNYQIFQRALWNLLQEEAENNEQPPLNYSEICELYDVLFQGWSNIALSFLRTREEKIEEQVVHLQELRDFTHDIIRTFNLEEILDVILGKMTSLFEVERGYFAVYRGGHIQEFFSRPESGPYHDIEKIAEETITEQSCVFIDESGDREKEVDKYRLKRIVAVPVQAHGSCYGVLILKNIGKGFRFTQKELDFVYQFLYIAAVAMENAFMMEEIEQSRQELHLLAAKMITIQEEERRILAGDIHDTIAQALTGISYKIEFCKEISRRDPKALMGELDSLLRTVYGAIDQSREIISSLRPDLIDTIGLVPALNRHIAQFQKETGIHVVVDFPDDILLSSRLNICLFRVAQEALMNIHKHAKTRNADIRLARRERHVFFAVSDNGNGFDATKAIPWVKDQSRLGLLSMKERVEAVGGTLHIHSGPGRGCRIEAVIPLRAEGAKDEEDQHYDR